MRNFDDRIKLTSEILQKIAKIDEFKGLWQGSLTLNPKILSRLKASVIITSTGASTRIEGSRLNDDEVARLLRGLHAKPPRNRDEQEVAGYADLIGRILDNYKTFKLTEGQILQFHELLLHFSEKDRLHKGKYKTTDNKVVMKTATGEEVVMFQPSPAYLIKKEMDDILYWTTEAFESMRLHPLLSIANFIFEFLAIHPFADGNGRLSRALTNLLLLKAGYRYIPYVSLDEIIEERRIDYYLALRATQKLHKTDREDITAWSTFFLDVLIEQTVRAKQIMSADQPETILSEKQLRVYGVLNKGEILSIGDIQKKLGDIPRITINQALSRLVELKLIERIGLGRATRYRKIA